MDSETIRLILDMGASGKNVEEVTARLRTLDTELDKAAVSTEKLGSKMAGTGQSLLQGGRVVQDFAQGGLGGILNNIEGLTMALGMGPGLAGVLTVLGVVALTAGPAIKDAFNAWVDGSNDIPKSTDALEAMTDALKANKDALDELQKKQHLTNTELAEYNRLTKETEQLEKDAKEAKKARAQEDKLGELRPQGAAEAEHDRAEELQAHVGGRQDEIAKAMETNLQHQIDVITKQLRSYKDVAPDDQEGLEKRTKQFAIWFKQLYRLIDIQKKQSVKSMLSGAVIGGKEADIRQSMEFLPELDGLPGADIRKAMESVLPETIAKQDAADKAFDEGNERAHDRRIAREKNTAVKTQQDKDVAEAEENARQATLEIEAAEKRDQDKELVKTRKAEAIRKAVEKQRFDKNELTGKLLGDDFLGESEAALLDADPNQRGGVRKRIGQAARQKLRNAGLNSDQAADATQDLDEFLNRDITRQLREMGMGKGRNAERELAMAIRDVIANQAGIVNENTNIMQMIRMGNARIGQELNQNGRSGGTMGTW